MQFDVDAFESCDPSRERALSGALRKLLRRGYGVVAVDEGSPATQPFPWGYGSEGVQDTRVWNVAVNGAPCDPGFAGILTIRQTTMSYRTKDPRDLPERPDTFWHEFLPESAAVAAALKRHDGY
jgi:hypothetical protein